MQAQLNSQQEPSQNYQSKMQEDLNKIIEMHHHMMHEGTEDGKSKPKTLNNQISLKSLASDGSAAGLPKGIKSRKEAQSKENHHDIG